MIEIKSLRGETYKNFIKVENGKISMVSEFSQKNIHYQNEKGEWKEIEIDMIDFGDNLITNKNKLSYGFRKDLNVYKYFGLRSDYDHQFESTLKYVSLKNKFSNLEYDLITAGKFDSIKYNNENNTVTHNFKNIKIYTELYNTSFKNYVITPKDLNIEDFETIEQFHLKGLKIKNSYKEESNTKIYTPDEFNEFTIVKEDDDSFLFKIPQPVFIDKNKNVYDYIDHSLILNSDGELIYIKNLSDIGKEKILNIDNTELLIDVNFDLNLSSFFYTQAILSGSFYLDNSSWEKMVKGTQSGITYSYNTSTSNVDVRTNIGNPPNYATIKRVEMRFRFDLALSNIYNNINSAKIKFYTTSNSTSPVPNFILVKRDPNITPANTGYFFGTSTGITTYSNYFNTKTYNYIDVNLNSIALTDLQNSIENSEIFSFYIREYDLDYLANYNSGSYIGDNIYGYFNNSDVDNTSRLIIDWDIDNILNKVSFSNNYTSYYVNETNQSILGIFSALSDYFGSYGVSDFDELENVLEVRYRLYDSPSLTNIIHEEVVTDSNYQINIYYHGSDPGLHYYYVTQLLYDKSNDQYITSSESSPIAIGFEILEPPKIFNISNVATNDTPTGQIIFDVQAVSNGSNTIQINLFDKDNNLIDTKILP